MGNYTYSFSTGEIIDTMEVSGYVLESENLEPIKGILVGLYADHADSAFKTKPMLRVSRTDSRGRFVIKVWLRALTASMPCRIWMATIYSARKAKNSLFLMILSCRQASRMYDRILHGLIPCISSR